MVMTSVGYPGPITAVVWPDLADSLGKEYTVGGALDWRVTSLSNGQLQASVAAGMGAGHGVRDVETVARTVTFDPQTSSGVRYDVVVARRTWGTTKATTFAVIKGGATPAGSIALRNSTPGVLDDQPLAVVPISFGSSNPGTPIDVRVWQANGGAVANDDLVLQYVNDPGSRILINGRVWHRTVTPGGQLSWSTSFMLRLPMFGALGHLAGSPNFNDGALLQAGSTVATTDGAGYARVTFPTPFPNSLLTFLPTNGDQSIDRSHGDLFVPGVAGSPWGTGNLTDVVYSMMRITQPGRNTGGLPHRLNWIAIGA